MKIEIIVYCIIAFLNCTSCNSKSEIKRDVIYGFKGKLNCEEIIINCDFGEYSKLVSVNVNSGASHEVYKAAYDSVITSFEIISNNDYLLAVCKRQKMEFEDSTNIYRFTNGKLIYINKFGGRVRDIVCKNEIVYFSIYFKIGKNSPIGINRPKLFKIFKINLDNRSFESISEVSFYSINGLSLADTTNLYLGSYEGDSSGIYKYSLNDVRKRTRIEPAGYSNIDLKLMYQPYIISSEAKLIFLSTYELLELDLVTKSASSIIKSGNKYKLNIARFTTCNNHKLIVIQLEGTNDLFLYNRNGEEIKKIDLTKVFALKQE